MRPDYHPAVQGDFNEAIAYYEAAGGLHLANRFEVEFRSYIAAIKSGPTRFPFYQNNLLSGASGWSISLTSSSIGKSRI